MIERITGLLETLREEHYECDDPYYSCQLLWPDGHLGDMKSQGCTCGADRKNKTIDEIEELLGWLV